MTSILNEINKWKINKLKLNPRFYGSVLGVAISFVLLYFILDDLVDLNLVILFHFGILTTAIGLRTS